MTKHSRQDHTDPSKVRVLQLDSSSRYDGSVTRQLTSNFIQHLESDLSDVEVTVRDVATGLPFIDDAWINANFTPQDKRTKAQNAALKLSDDLVAELQQSDILVMGVPVYNFSVPATLKTWIDLVARAGLTFHYTENGPQGLLQNKKAYVILASGGTAIGSAIDFASGYLRHVLGFIGINDVEIISAERLNVNQNESLTVAQQQIAASVKNIAAGESRAA
ncbi:FMN-dependent NADH-azoreductase [Kaarinaea lacus]